MVETVIQAVSPLLGVGGAGLAASVAAAAAGAAAVTAAGLASEAAAAADAAGVWAQMGPEPANRPSPSTMEAMSFFI